MSRTSTVLLIAIALASILASCGRSEKAGASDGNAEASDAPSPIDFTPYSVEDSARIVNYEDGLQLYTVLEGPGDFPVDGNDILVHYHGLLSTGKVFDSSYDRGEPLKVRLGQGKLIKGFEKAMKQLRMGSKAIAFIPPELGYGSKEDVPNVPPNSSLIFHLEVLGTF